MQPMMPTSMTVDPTNQSEVAWTSWLPAMGYALGASTGPILEIGCGHFSTPFLHEYCRGADRLLWSIESNGDWRARFSQRYQAPFHSFDHLAPNFPVDWGVVFIDNSPGGEARAAPFREHLNFADYVVVHDYHRENEQAIAPLLTGVNHRIYKDYEPPTLLASSKHPL
jgi:hypothetical protein